MRTVPLGASGLKVSEICLGALTFGMPKFGCDEAESQRIVDAFIEAGETSSTPRIRTLLAAQKRSSAARWARRRSDIVLATKFGHHTGPGVNERGSSRRHIMAALEASLRRLGTDYVDLYQAHFYDDSTPIEETLDALADCVRAGKVRYIGCCNYYSWQLAEANKIAEHRQGPEFVSCQIIYNVVKRDAEHRYFKFAESQGVSLLGYSPLQSGILAGVIERDRPFPANSRVAASDMHRRVWLSDEERIWKCVDAVKAGAQRANVPMSVLSLGWVLRKPAISSVLIGASSAAELTENLSALDLDVDPDIWAELDQATSIPPSYPNDFYDRLVMREGQGN